jgi:hypothetical protein
VKNGAQSLANQPRKVAHPVWPARHQAQKAATQPDGEVLGLPPAVLPDPVCS